MLFCFGLSFTMQEVSLYGHTCTRHPKSTAVAWCPLPPKQSSFLAGASRGLGQTQLFRNKHALRLFGAVSLPAMVSWLLPQPHSTPTLRACPLIAQLVFHFPHLSTALMLSYHLLPHSSLPPPAMVRPILPPQSPVFKQEMLRAGSTHRQSPACPQEWHISS